MVLQDFVLLKLWTSFKQNDTHRKENFYHVDTLCDTIAIRRKEKVKPKDSQQKILLLEVRPSNVHYQFWSKCIKFSNIFTGFCRAYNNIICIVHCLQLHRKAVSNVLLNLQLCFLHWHMILIKCAFNTSMKHILHENVGILWDSEEGVLSRRGCCCRRTCLPKTKATKSFFEKTKTQSLFPMSFEKPWCSKQKLFPSISE